MSANNLRKHYGRLNPRERATMSLSACLTRDAGLTVALRAPTQMDALRESKYEAFYIMTAAHCLHCSQLADSAQLAAQLHQVMTPAGKGDSDADVDRYGTFRLSWVLALQDFDAAHRTGCMNAARMIAPIYCQAVLDEIDAAAALRTTPEYAAAIRNLEELWTAFIGKPAAAHFDDDEADAE